MITEINLVFSYNPIKTFHLINKWVYNNYPNVILFEFWRQNKYLIDLLPEYMNNHIMKHDYGELYQDLYFDKLDT